MAVDVTVYGSGSNTTIYTLTGLTDWDAVHDAAGARVYDPAIPVGHANKLVASAMKGSTGEYSIYRSFLYFDLSGIAVGSEIGTVQLHLYVYSKDGTAPVTSHPGDLYISQGVQDDPISTYPDPCNFDGSPFCDSYNFGDQLPYTTSWGFIAHNDVTPGQYNAVTLNAVGLAALNLGGAQKFCIRVRADLLDEPVVANDENDNVIYYSQEQGEDYRPKLVFSEIYKKVYPTANLTRVTAIRHIYRPGLFRMEVTLGDVQNAVDMIDSRTEVGVPGPGAPLWERMKYVTELEKAAGVHWTQTGKIRTVPPDWETRISPGQPVVPYQYTPEVPQPFPPTPTPTPSYTPEAPQPTYVPPIMPSFLDIFKERMWSFMKDPLTQIQETWGKIKWW